MDRSTSESSINRCRKAGRHVNGRTGGVFSFFCLKHGFCYGFHVMPFSEGRNDPFSVLKTYLRKAPKIIVYDFACSLEEYCLNRDPDWFRDTLFVIDRFHWKNHYGCPKAFNMSNYTGLYGKNSSICEQYHAYLSRFRAAASGMKLANFVRWLRLWVDLWNADKVQAMLSE